MFWNRKKETAALDLKDFVRESLLSIFDAVHEAGTAVASDPNRRGVIAPLWGNVSSAQGATQAIEFDVAVTSGLVKENEIKPGVKVLSAFEFGGRASNKTERSSVSRVKFSVPVVMPSTVVQ